MKSLMTVEAVGNGFSLSVTYADGTVLRTFEGEEADAKRWVEAWLKSDPECEWERGAEAESDAEKGGEHVVTDEASIGGGATDPDASGTQSEG